MSGSKPTYTELREALEIVLAALEIPGTADDFYDKCDFVGSAVLHGRKILRKSENATERDIKHKIIQKMVSPAIKDFMIRLVQMKHEAGKLELWETMHSIEEPIRKVGWEVAERLGAGKKEKAE